MSRFQNGYALGVVPESLLQVARTDEKAALEMAFRFIAQTPYLNQFIQEFAEKFLGLQISTLADYTSLLVRFWDIEDGDAVNQHLRNTLRFVDDRSPLHPAVRPLLVTGDGSMLSIQAGYKYASWPNTLIGPFSDVEVQTSTLPLPDAEIEDYGKEGDTYFHYPVEALNRIIADHGGASVEYTRRVEELLAQFSLDFDQKAGQFEGQDISFTQYLRDRNERLKQISAEIAAGAF